MIQYQEMVGKPKGFVGQNGQVAGEACTNVSVEIRLAKQTISFKGIHIIKDKNNNPKTISIIDYQEQLHIIWTSEFSGPQSKSTVDGPKLVEYKGTINV